jgi:hypothetical protein
MLAPPIRCRTTMGDPLWNLSGAWLGERPRAHLGGSAAVAAVMATTGPPPWPAPPGTGSPSERATTPESPGPGGHSPDRAGGESGPVSGTMVSHPECSGNTPDHRPTKEHQRRCRRYGPGIQIPRPRGAFGRGICALSCAAHTQHQKERARTVSRYVAAPAAGGALRPPAADGPPAACPSGHPGPGWPLASRDR